MKKGHFFAFEGIDGCGKSTQVALLQKKLTDSGYKVLVTREPGGTVISEKIREIIITPQHSEMVNECEVLLYLAARAQHVKEKIVPALSEGVIVLCDRFQLATFAYQGYGRSNELTLLEDLNRYSTGGLAPDMTFVFDIPVDEAFNRMKQMNKSQDRLELTGAEFFHRIRHGYLEMASKCPQEISVVDANRSKEVIHQEIIHKIEELISG